MTDTVPERKADKLLHAYIISGGSAAAREAYALRIAMGAVCGGEGKAPCGQCRHCLKAAKGLHPDIAFVEKHEDKKELTVDIVRTLRAEAYILPNEAERKVYIIRAADIMNPEAQNAILKILEEPPAFVVFLLLAENPSRLLPTVRSRCAVMTVKAQERETGSEEAKAFVDTVLSGDKVALAAAVMTFDKIEKQDFPAFLEDVKRTAMDRLRHGRDRERLMKLIDAIAEAEKYQAVNVGRIHISGMMLSRLV